MSGIRRKRNEEDGYEPHLIVKKERINDEEEVVDDNIDEDNDNSNSDNANTNDEETDDEETDLDDDDEGEDVDGNIDNEEIYVYNEDCDNSVTDISENQHEESDSSNTDTNNADDNNNANDEDTDIDENDLNDINDDDDDDHANHEITQDGSHIEWAMRNGQPIYYILELIERYPMEVQQKDRNGYYPLHTACEYHLVTIARKLIEIFPEAAQHKILKGLHCPLHMACYNNLSAIAMMLIEVFPEAAQYKESEDELYPLHYALLDYASEDVVMKLIQIFPKAVMEKSMTGYTTLSMACTAKDLSETLMTKIIEIYPLAIQEHDEMGAYPIHSAILCRQSIPNIKLILDGDPLGLQRRVEGELQEGVEGDSNAGATPFHLACQTNYVDLVEYLLQRSDLQINSRDSKGMTPLHYACNEFHAEIVELLLNHPDIDINATDSMNDTPLHIILKCKAPELRYMAPEPQYYDPLPSFHIFLKLTRHSWIIIDQKNNNNQTPLDLMSAHLDELEKLDERPTIQELDLVLVKTISHSLKEFPIKKRWNAYDYHVKNFMEKLF